MLKFNYQVNIVLPAIFLIFSFLGVENFTWLGKAGFLKNQFPALISSPQTNCPVNIILRSN